MSWGLSKIMLYEKKGARWMDKGSCCACGGSIKPGKNVLIEYLYLDLNSCYRCIGTEEELDKVVSILNPALELAGYILEYRKIEILNKELAEKHQFLSSPTIRVNGEDICQSVAENNCGCCGEISGTDVDCRIFEYNGGTYEVAPKEMLAEAILKEGFGITRDSDNCSEYRLPANLKAFFDGKILKDHGNCSGGSGCC